ncbi:hypothetical protein BKA61DRAFT_42168 [Leptodontidium sp. MPI-SDFR-AT-0119]|nr:hypothetical protein BKA61DRAFT_42168 [Leptodontidium sp. MPI-SDFR-AT-0119]
MVQQVYTTIEIACPPERVREFFLDASKWPSWPEGIQLTRLDPKDNSPVKVGEKLKLLAGGTTLYPTIVTNTPTTVAWHGSIHGVIIGTHTFEFFPSENPTNPGGTKLVHREDFTGLLEFLMGGRWPAWAGGQRVAAETRYAAFNKFLKGAVEGL